MNLLSRLKLQHFKLCALGMILNAVERLIRLSSQKKQLSILWALRRKRHLLKKAKQISKALLPRAADGYMWQKLRTEPMDARRVSLRALMISRMYQMMNDDAQVGRRQNTMAVLESK